MYLDHFKLREKPFSLTSDPRFFYMSKQHESALTFLQYGLREKAGIVLMTGDIGTGKTSLIKHLVSSKYEFRNTKLISVQDTAIIGNDLTSFLCEELGAELPLNASRATSFKAMQNKLTDLHRKRMSVVLLIDESQCLSDEQMDEVRMLTSIQAGSHQLLQVLLVGQTDLRTRFQSPELYQLAQRVSVTTHLKSLPTREIAPYVEHRLRVAGREKPGLFNKGALQLLYKGSAGVPRIINSLCDTALTFGYADSKAVIDREAVHDVLESWKESGLFQLHRAKDISRYTATKTL